MLLLHAWIGGENQHGECLPGAEDIYKLFRAMLHWLFRPFNNCAQYGAATLEHSGQQDGAS